MTEKAHYGKVDAGGMTIELREQAELTNRLLPGHVNYQDVADGEEYDAEWMARGTTPTGEDCRVYWIQTGRKGNNDILPEDCNWGEPSRILIGEK